MWPFKSLQIHVTHACNLSCVSCSHYSNHGHKGMLDLETAEGWMRPWDGRLAPKAFVILGGEPTIHPRLPDFVRLARRHFPTSQVQVVTNAFFLDRQPDLPVAMQEIGNARLDISVHHESWQYGTLISQGLQLAQTWAKTHGIEVYVKESFKSWRLQYQGHGAEMMPYEDGNPQASWDICPAKHCFQLLDGDIFKCAPLAYLPMQQAKYGLSEKWAPYLAYQPLHPTCDDEALRQFFSTGAEAVCDMCAAYPRHVDKPWPLPAPTAGRR
jgi:hypothetical protein